MKLFSAIFIFIICSNIFAANITIQSQGFSIIGQNLNKARENAIQDAITKGVKKFLKLKNIEPSSKIIENIKTNAISGFEIIKETTEGNILKEKIDLIINEEALNDIIKTKVQPPENVLISCFLNNEYNEDLTNFLIKILSQDFDFTFIKNSDFYNKELSSFKIGIICEINLIEIKKLISINKIFYKLNGKIEIYNSGNKYDEFNFQKDLTLSSEKDYIEYLIPLIKDKLKEDIFLLKNRDNVKSNKEDLELFFTLIKPEKFEIIEKIEEIFDNYNLVYSLIMINKGDVVFKIKGITEEELISILKNSNFIYRFKISENEEGKL